MSTSPSPSDTDIIRALELVTEDQRGDLFYKHPFEIDILKRDLSWLERISTQLAENKYTAAQARPVDVPKPGYHIRPAAHLSLEDQVAISYLLIKCKQTISKAISWSEGTIRQSHWISEGGSWFKDAYSGWKHFREKSIQTILNGAKFVFITDISGYYENIDLSKLSSDLKNLSIPTKTADQISSCLNKWAGPRRRGIPQGYNPSHLLGELYLDSFDHNLQDEGFTHLRYLDDIRVFARTEQEARRALHRVTVLLRERGLNLQTSKSKILSGDEATALFDGVAPIIKNVSEEIAKELDLLEEIGYVGMEESRRALENLSSPPLEVLQRTWRQFEQGSLGGFDKTLFHYLLNRLGKAKVPDAVDYSLRLLTERPEETSTCLHYLQQTNGREAEIAKAVAEIIQSRDTLFIHQVYTCLRWLFDNKLRIESVVEHCRSLSTWSPERFIVRPYAIAYIGLFASLRDFERLEGLYRDSSDWLDRATVICAYRNAIIDMRNAFYGRVRGEHELVDRAIAYSKAA
ncbi:RNA-directed DNA polymerase [Corallococcus carmarthensis]|uniref:RNA-directed DNA polymerase n=1 Tax=Corallococcus carmarthensis TaxID=2316728 RepID=A0A3A8K915_9BACT|nr:RNA-directed DNA polymerase [Corallococcus carmarthensis]RKH04688.1 RNA-directed DNA polymerase [Corallococcus carmarthensis]